MVHPSLSITIVTDETDENEYYLKIGLDHEEIATFTYNLQVKA